MYNPTHTINDRNTSLILLVLIIIVGFAISLILMKNQQKISKKPINGITVTRSNLIDVTSSTMGLYIRTKMQETPRVYFGSDPKNIATLLLDVRDTEVNQQARYNHIYKVDNLQKDKMYYFKIDSMIDKNGKIKNEILSTKTGSVTKNISNQPIYGTLVDVLNIGVSDTIVLVKIKNARHISTITKLDGTFLLSTCCVINQLNNEYIKINDSDAVTIEFINEPGDFLKIEDVMSNVSPFANSVVYERGTKKVNNIVLNQSLTPAQNDKPMVLGELTKQKENSEFEIMYPTDIGVIPGNLPLIKGTGIPGKIVTVTVDKNREIQNTVIDERGVWTVALTKKLSAGAHQLSADSVDSQGKNISLTRKFTIGKSGEQVLGSATNSATLTPTDSIAPTSSPTNSPTTTATPSATISAITPLLPAGTFNISSLVILSMALVLAGLGLLFIF